MNKALIVSPDPETATMLTLALELEGWEAGHTTEPSDSMAHSVDAVVLDLVEGLHELKSAEKNLSVFGDGPKKVVLLPRGCDRQRAEKQIASADLLITRPFHLTNLVKQLLTLAE